MGLWNNMISFFKDTVNEHREPEHVVVQRTGEEEFLDYNLSTAFDIFSKRSQNGDGRADYFLGLLYDNGYGIVKSDKQKAKWFYQKGIDAGDTLCSARLMLVNAKEDAIKNNSDILVKTALESMAKEGDVFAMNEMASLYMHENNEPGQWNIKAAQAGYWKAMLDLARFYQHDDNHASSFRYAEMAVNRGCTIALRILGECYLEGKGITKDEKKGLQMLIESNMVEPDSNVQYKIGLIYHAQGKHNSAFNYFKQAVNSGNKDARFYVGKAYLHGDGTKRNVQKGINILEKIANQGNIDAAIELFHSIDKNAVQKGYKFLRTLQIVLMLI